MSTVAPKAPNKPASQSTNRPPFKVKAFDLLAEGRNAEAYEIASLGRKEIMLA
jgi:hypothetical protein